LSLILQAPGSSTKFINYLSRTIYYFIPQNPKALLKPFSKHQDGNAATWRSTIHCLSITLCEVFQGNSTSCRLYCRLRI